MKIVIKTNELLKIEKLFDFCKENSIDLEAKGYQKIRNYSNLKNRLIHIQDYFKAIYDQKEKMETLSNEFERNIEYLNKKMKEFDELLKESIESQPEY